MNRSTKAEDENGFPQLCAASRALRSLVAGAVAGSLVGACTIVRVSDGAAVTTRYYPGVAVVRVSPGAAMQVVDVESVGLALVGNHFNLGWLDSRTALVPPGRCQLLVWRGSEAGLAELRRLLGPRTELCTQEGEVR